jgi:endoglucanase
MRVIAIDWSGNQGPAQRKTLWLAEAQDNALVRLENGRTREEIAEYLIAEARCDPRFVVGFDFAFSLPAWFLADRDLADAPALWALAEREAEGWLRECAPPFWGRPGKGRPAGVEQYRHADRAVPRTGGIAPKPVFQIGGAGAVGTGSLRGMPILHRLRTAGFTVWPFDPPSWPRIVEIYPRLLTGAVTKSSDTARSAYLAAQHWAIPPALLPHALGGEDAFDAAISALLMARHADDLADLPATTDPQILREGAIWHPGWRDDPTPAIGQPQAGKREGTMREESKAFLTRLLQAAGPSNYEVEAARVWRAEAEGFCAEVTTDVNGNTVARLRSDVAPGAKKVLLAGHIDEIGLIVTHINDDGTLAFRSIGGWDAQVLIGQRLRILARGGHVTGVIGRKAAHLMRGDDRDKGAKIEDLWIDIGASKKEEAVARVRVGDAAVIDAQPVMLTDDLMASRAHDDRCCAFIALETLRLLSEGEPPLCDVYAAATVQEEITFRGAHTVAATLAPDVAIALDVTHASDRPGAAPQEVGAHGVGSGAAITRGSVANEALVDLLIATAERENLPYTLEASGRHSGTDADAMVVTGRGTAGGVISVPCRYMHSPVEIVSLTDLETCAKLLAATIRAIGPETDFVPK